MKQPETKNQQTRGMPKLFWAWKKKDAQCLGVGTSKEKRGEKRKRGVGLFKRGIELLVEVPRDLREDSFK